MNVYLFVYLLYYSSKTWIIYLFLILLLTISPTAYKCWSNLFAATNFYRIYFTLYASVCIFVFQKPFWFCLWLTRGFILFFFIYFHTSISSPSLKLELNLIKARIHMALPKQPNMESLDKPEVSLLPVYLLRSSFSSFA